MGHRSATDDEGEMFTNNVKFETRISRHSNFVNKKLLPSDKEAAATSDELMKLSILAQDSECFQLYTSSDVITKGFHEEYIRYFRENVASWQLLSGARNEPNLFPEVFWPKDLKMKGQGKLLYLLVTVKDHAANSPKDLEARIPLQVSASSFFMPESKSDFEMISYSSVFTPYYSEDVRYNMPQLLAEKEDVISISYRLQEVHPGLHSDAGKELLNMSASRLMQAASELMNKAGPRSSPDGVCLMITGA